MSSHRKQNNIFLVVIFAGCVLFLIGVSLAIKLFGAVRESTYSSNERFTVLLLDNASEAIYLSVHESETTASKVTVEKVKGIPDLPIPLDGVVRVSSDIESNKSLPSLISEVMIKRNEERAGMTFIDVIRMYIAARKIPREDVKEVIIKDVKDGYNLDYQDFFFDQKIIDEDKTISIENASAKSGVASKLENVLLGMGGNIISVETSVNNQPRSKILYQGEPSYTLEKVQKLLGYPIEQTEDAQVSDIFIIIGENGFNNLVFPNE